MVFERVSADTSGGTLLLCGAPLLRQAFKKAAYTVDMYTPSRSKVASGAHSSIVALALQ